MKKQSFYRTPIYTLPERFSQNRFSFLLQQNVFQEDKLCLCLLHTYPTLLYDQPLCDLFRGLILHRLNEGDISTRHSRVTHSPGVRSRSGEAINGSGFGLLTDLVLYPNICIYVVSYRRFMVKGPTALICFEKMMHENMASIKNIYRLRCIT